MLNVDISFAAASFVVFDVAKYPEIRSNLHTELDDLLGSTAAGEVDDLESRLPFLSKVIKESARMHPALGITFPEKTVKEVTNMNGYLVPKGVSLTDVFPSV